MFLRARRQGGDDWRPGREREGTKGVSERNIVWMNETYISSIVDKEHLLEVHHLRNAPNSVTLLLSILHLYLENVTHKHLSMQYMS